MSYEERAAHLADMIEERLGVRGRGLAAKLKRAGRLLPKHVHRDAEILLEAIGLQSHPKLARRIDAKSVALASDNVEAHLSGIDPKARRVDRFLNLLASNAVNLLVTATLVICVLLWRGYL
jgi:hypothetical protein